MTCVPRLLWARVGTCAVATVVLLGNSGCTPKIVRAPQASQRASDDGGTSEAQQVDLLLSSGWIKKDEIQKGRTQNRILLEQLTQRASPDEPLKQLSIRRAELTVGLYERLAVVQESPQISREERSRVAAQLSQEIRTYLRDLARLEQDVELVPLSPDALAPSGASALEVSYLAPPSSERLVTAYRAGRFDQVIKEVEGSGPDGVARLAPEGAAVYALSLGSQHRYEEAATTASRFEEQALVSQEASEVLYRRALWLLKLGKKEESQRVLQKLSGEIPMSRGVLTDLSERVRLTLDETSRTSSRFAGAVVDILLLLEDDKFEAARAGCRKLLEQESSAEAVSRVETLLRQIDETELRAFDERVKEVMALASSQNPTGAVAALEALELVAQQYTDARFKEPIEKARGAIRSPASALGKEGVAPAEAKAAPPLTATPAAKEKSDPVTTADAQHAKQPTGPPGPPAPWQKDLAQGQSLATTGRFEEAITALSPVFGTAGDGEARSLRLRYVDLYVQQVRERVAADYLRAQQLRTAADKLALYGDIYKTLKGTLEKYPDTTLRSKAEHNLKVIEGELKKLDPKYFERHEEFKYSTPPYDPSGSRP